MTENNYNDYTLLKEGHIPYLQGICHLYRHKTGAKVVYIKNNDPISVFSLSFHTPPEDDTGVAHIVEHCLLSGSEKYPLKDPSAELEKGSLYTYLNAMTNNNFTIYLGGSYNEKSLFHMMDVYFDAVFRPNIKKKETFLREGWHYEYIKETDEIKISGIVYNEMSAYCLDPMAKISRIIKNGFFHSISEKSMKFNTAGYIDEIPNLTYEKFLEFYNNHYTPDNCVAFFYGTLDPKKCFSMLDYYLNNTLANGCFEKPMAYNSVHTKDLYIDDTYQLNEINGNLQNKNILSLAYILENVENHSCYELLCDLLLISLEKKFNKKISLEKRLFKEKIAENYTINLVTENDKPPYIQFIAQNSSYDARYFKDAVEELLSDIVKHGFNKDLLKNVFHSKELFYREKDFGYRTSGIVNALKCSFHLIEGLDIFHHLDILNRLSEWKEKALNDNYFEKLTKAILNSPQKVFVTLKAVNYDIKFRHKNLDNLTTEQKEYIKNDNFLQIYNNMPDNPCDLSKIPNINLSDIKKISDIQPYEIIDNRLLFCPLESDKLMYINFCFDLSEIPKEYWNVLGLLKCLLLHIGTENFSHDKLTTKLGAISNYSTCLESHVNAKKNEFYPVFSISFKLLEENDKNIFQLVDEIINNSIFYDKSQIKDILTSFTASIRPKIISEGNVYAMKKALSPLFASCLFSEATSGIEFYKYVYKYIIEELKDLSGFSDKLQKVYNMAINKRNLTICVGAQQNTRRRITELTDRLFDNVSYVNTSIGKREMTMPIIMPEKAFRCAINIPSEVAYNALAVDIGNENSCNGAFAVLGNILYNYLLVPEIRRKGGAYDCGVNIKNGVFAVNSYRDPNISATYDVFKKIPDFIRNIDLSQKDMEKAILGTIKIIDMPKKNSEKFSFACLRHFTGISNEYIQNERDEILSTDLEKIRSFAPFFENAFNKISICSLANKDLEKNKALFESIEIL